MSAAEVLAAHRSYYVHGDDSDRCSGCDWKGNGCDEFEAHQLDALKVAGYAVVELPKSDGLDDDGQEIFGDFARVDHTAKGTDYPVIYLGSLPTAPANARREAAIILAAADAAEAQS